MSDKRVNKQDYIVDGVLYSEESRMNIDRIRDELNGVYLSDCIDAIRVREWFKKRYKDTTDGMWILQLAVMLRVVNGQFDSEYGKKYRGWQRLSTKKRVKKEKKIRKLINELRDELCFKDFVTIKLGIQTVSKSKGGWHDRKDMSVLLLLNYLQNAVDLATKIPRTTHKEGIDSRYYASLVNTYFYLFKLDRMPNRVIASIVCLRFPELEVTEYDIKNWGYKDKKARKIADTFARDHGVVIDESASKFLCFNQKD